MTGVATPFRSRILRLRSPGTLLTLTTAALLCILPATAQADVYCGHGYRPPNAAELAFNKRIMALMAALPSPPAGWKIKSEDNGIPDDLQICRDADAELAIPSIIVDMKRSYVRSDIEQRQKKLMTAMDKMQSWHPSAAQQKIIDEDNAKAQILMKKIGEAAEKNDFAAQKKYMDEYQKYGKEAAAIQQKPMLDFKKLSDRLLDNTSATVSMQINIESWDSNYENPAPLHVANATAAFREMIPKEDREDGQGDNWCWTTVLFGPWKDTRTGDDPYLRFRAQLPEVKGGTVIQAIYLRIAADKSTADALLAKLNTAALKTAIANASH